jgi:hypothetical protein
MQADENPVLNQPVLGRARAEIVRVCRESLREESERVEARVYVRMLAVLRALEQPKHRHGFDLAGVYEQLNMIATGAEEVSDAVVREAARVVRLGMPGPSSFYTQYVSKAFNKLVRMACQRLSLTLIAVVSRAKVDQHEYFYLKWENKAASERRTPRNRSPDAADSETQRTSVFIPGPAVVHPRRFFGRERELARLFGLVRSHPMQCAVVVGPPRIGKSSLLRCVEKITTVAADQLRPGQRGDWLPDPRRHRWIYVDFLDPRMKKAEGVFRAMLAAVGSPVPSLLDQERFLEEMGRALDQPTVVLMDHIDKALGREQVDDENELLSLGFWEGLRSLASASGNLAYLLASREKADQLAERFQVFASPFFNLFGHIIQLGPLEVAAARELIASSPTQFPSEDVDEIIKLSERLPLALQMLCSERLFALETGDRSGEWRENALQEIKWAHRPTPPE